MPVDKQYEQVANGYERERDNPKVITIPSTPLLSKQEKQLLGMAEIDRSMALSSRLFLWRRDGEDSSQFHTWHFCLGIILEVCSISFPWSTNECTRWKCLKKVESYKRSIKGSQWKKAHSKFYCAKESAMPSETCPWKSFLSWHRAKGKEIEEFIN